MLAGTNKRPPLSLLYMSDKNQYNNLKFENQKLKTSAESKRDL
jgi:hypothetical protein